MQFVLRSSFLLPSISIFIFISVQFKTSFCANWYTNCSQIFNCGALENISYPFWGLNRPDYCGQPGFHLECQDNIPKIKMLQNTFRVLGITPEQQTLKLARDDYWDDMCPTELVNTTIDFNRFSNVPTLWNLTLYYNCSSSDNSNSYSYYTPSPQFLSCPINASTTNFSYSFDPISSLNSILLEECVSNVRIPINETAAMILYQDPTLVNDKVKAGFDLNWNLNNDQCEKCLTSSGVCGFNVTTTLFTCFCQNNQSWPNTCPSKPGSKTKKITVGAGLGIAGAAIAGILLGGWGLFAIQRRRRRNEVQSKSKDMPLPPSSIGLTSTTISTDRSRSIASYSSSDIERGSTYFGVQVFTYTELQAATDNFNPDKELGDGGFGTVYYGVLNDGRIVAVKRLYENNLKRVAQFKNEIKILADIRHPNLVTLYGCTSRHSRELLLVYEYIPNGTVAEHLHGRRAQSSPLTWPTRLNIAIETANALAYLHSRDIIHRDVKTNNILLDNNFRVKVADFGLSRLFPNDVTHVSTAPQGTPGYVDPEYYQCYHLTEKSDVYSLGVVLAELISAKEAVDVTRHRYDINLASMVVSRVQNRALRELVDPSLDVDNDCDVRRMVTSMAELAFRCLQQERDLRPSMEEVVEALREMKDGGLGGDGPEVVDIGGDDVGLLRHVPPPLSPDSGASDKWMQIRTM